MSRDTSGPCSTTKTSARTSNNSIALRLPTTVNSDNPLRLPFSSHSNLMEGSVVECLDFGKMGYGCKHYRRRCRIRAPCCNEVYSCRHCHNEATSMLKNPIDRHELVRQDVEQVVCSVCDIEQPVAHVCTNCGIRMGEYFCDICRFFDDDTGKQQFHCDDCGICRVGGSENYFHCKKCGSCYSIALRDNHLCLENSMRHHCPICYEYLFDSLKDTRVMKYGHRMHGECFQEMLKRDKFCCPICSKSVMDMSLTWKRIDEEIETTTVCHFRSDPLILTATVFSPTREDRPSTTTDSIAAMIPDRRHTFRFTMPSLSSSSSPLGMGEHH